MNFWHLVIQQNPLALNKPQIGLIVPNLLEPRIILTSFHDQKRCLNIAAQMMSTKLSFQCLEFITQIFID